MYVYIFLNLNRQAHEIWSTGIGNFGEKYHKESVRTKICFLFKRVAS